MSEEKKADETIDEKYDFDIVEERIYTVPLWIKLRRTHGLKRAKKAAKFLREFVARHMKNPNVKISTEVNEQIWARGIRNPPRRIKVRVVRTSEEEIWVLPLKE
jgi:large subunit ribosomal protein L31e